MLHTIINPVEAIARDLESAIHAERAALAAVEAADGTPDFETHEAELARRMDASVELADRLLACPSRRLTDVLRKVRILTYIHRDGDGVVFGGGEEIGGVESYDGPGLDIRAVDAIIRDLIRLAA